jgi:hypothetical protein
MGEFDGRWFEFANWDHFPAWQGPARQLVQQIEQHILPWGKCESYPGSYSFVVNGKTLGKLAPEDPKNPRLMCGFSAVVPRAEEYARRLGTPERYVLGPSKEPFLMVPIDPETNGDAFCRLMISFLLWGY